MSLCRAQMFFVLFHDDDLLFNMLIVNPALLELESPLGAHWGGQTGVAFRCTLRGSDWSLELPYGAH